MDSSAQLWRWPCDRGAGRDHPHEVLVWHDSDSVRKQRRSVLGDGSADGVFFEESIVSGIELTHIFLMEVALTQDFALFFEKFGGDARAFGGGDAEAGPAVAALRPLAIKEALFAVGRAEEPEVAAAGGEHGAERGVELVRYLRGFIDDEEG